MAISRLSVKVGKAGSAGPHAAYIARIGKYASRLEHGEKLEATGFGNMPAWASNPLEFWNAADAFERKNGTTYREMEIALPRELFPEKRAELVRAFVRQEIGDRHAYQWAIHSPKAADGIEQPHVHLMFSERQRDGIERDPEQYFKRYNAKAPEKGGARKGYGASAGITLSAVERRAELRALRRRWEDVGNAHLSLAGVGRLIDMRSHAERGTGLDPEAKQLPSQWRGEGREKVMEFREARSALVSAVGQVRQVVPNGDAEIVDLRAARQAREAADAQRAADFVKLLGMQDVLVEEVERNYKNVYPQNLVRAVENEIRDLLNDQKALPEMIEIVPYLTEIQKESKSYVDETFAKETAKFVAQIEELKTHLDNEPVLFGKQKWRTREASLRIGAEHTEKVLKNLKAYPFQIESDGRAAAADRVKSKFPELARRALEALRQFVPKVLAAVQGRSEMQQQELHRQYEIDRTRSIERGEQRSIEPDMPDLPSL